MVLDCLLLRYVVGNLEMGGRAHCKFGLVAKVVAVELRVCTCVAVRCSVLQLVVFVLRVCMKVCMNTSTNL